MHQCSNVLCAIKAPKKCKAPVINTLAYLSFHMSMWKSPNCYSWVLYTMLGNDQERVKALIKLSVNGLVNTKVTLSAKNTHRVISVARHIQQNSSWRWSLSAKNK